MDSPERPLRYAPYALARARPLALIVDPQHAGKTGARVRRLLGRQPGRRGSLAHHTGVTLRKTPGFGGAGGGASRVYTCLRGRLDANNTADTPNGAH